MQSALNRHLQDLGRNKDIVRDKEFKSASHTLGKVMKVVTKTGGTRATQHNSVITSDELKNALLLSSCFIFSPSASAVCGSISLLILYLMGWYFITNSAQSFNFLFDNDAKEYVVLWHQTQQKISKDAFLECPVKIIRLLSKTDQAATNLFNALISPNMVSFGTCVLA